MFQKVKINIWKEVVYFEFRKFCGYPLKISFPECCAVPLLLAELTYTFLSVVGQSALFASGVGSRHNQKILLSGVHLGVGFKRKAVTNLRTYSSKEWLPAFKDQRPKMLTRLLEGTGQPLLPLPPPCNGDLILSPRCPGPTGGRKGYLSAQRSQFDAQYHQGKGGGAVVVSQINWMCTPYYMHSVWRCKIP